MRTDLRQSSRVVLSYDQIDRHIRHAQKLRSEAFARGAKRMFALVHGGTWRLLTRAAAGVRHAAERGMSAQRLAWLAAISSAARCRANRSPRCG